MKNKDTQLLEEAYQQVFEANFLTKAIDKGKEMLGMGPSKPLTFDEAKQQYKVGLEKIGLEVHDSRDGGAWAEYEGNGCPWWVSKEKDGFTWQGGTMSDMTWPTKKGDGMPDGTKDPNNQWSAYKFTTGNVNAILKQAKEALKLTIQAIEKKKKEAPEREKKDKELRDRYEQDKKDAFWAQRARSYQDTKSSEDTAKLIGKQRGY